MTTNKPEVLAYHVNKENPEHRGVTLEALVRLSDYEALQAECEQLRKDAERYRWLLQECYRWPPPHSVCSKEDQTEPVAIWTKFEGDDVDAAIDAAIIKEHEK